MRRLYQQIGLVGAAINSSIWAKLKTPAGCSSPRWAGIQDSLLARAAGRSWLSLWVCELLRMGNHSQGLLWL